ncbi:XdhC family protein [Xanthomonas translucens pv. translucens]|nr:XdhC family protein [Xanthomonas translucens]UII66109.1 XdhC family protein [Xanthomonas translucens]
MDRGTALETRPRPPGTGETAKSLRPPQPVQRAVTRGLSAVGRQKIRHRQSSLELHGIDAHHATWEASAGCCHSLTPAQILRLMAVCLQLDPHSAVVALTQDPKLGDMALLEALKSDAFYVGALGSRANTARRKERLALFDLAPHEIARLHGPVGLDLRARTRRSRCPSSPTILAVKNAVAVVHE